MKRVFVKVRNNGSSFTILSQGVVLGGNSNTPVEVDYDDFVKRAASGNVITVLTDNEIESLGLKTKEEKKIDEKVLTPEENKTPINENKGDENTQSNVGESNGVTKESILAIVEKSDYKEMMALAKQIGLQIKKGISKSELEVLLLEQTDKVS